MDSDVRVLPFTEEEKARLNEKVRKMKFTRPPPKLPVPRSAIILSPSRRHSSRASGSLDEKSVDDSGISSCGSEKCETPRSSPAYKVEQRYEVACDKYVCDGDDWVPDDSALEIKNDLEIDVCNTGLRDYVKERTNIDSTNAASDGEGIKDDSKDGGLEIDVHGCLPLSIDVSAVGPVEKIDNASPVVYSERLHAALTRKRTELLDISPLPDTPIGRFEEPRYGRLLLSSTFPTVALQQILTSVSKNLEGYRVLGRPRICLASGKPVPEPSLIDEIEAELKKERLEIEEPRPTVLKRKRKRRSRKPDDEESLVNLHDSALSLVNLHDSALCQDVKKEVLTDDNDDVDVPRKQRKELPEKPVVKTAAEPPIKMIFRKDADRKISGVRLEIPNLPISNAKEVKSSKSESSSSCMGSESKDSRPFSPTELCAIGTRLDNSNRPLKIRIKLPIQNSSSSSISIEKAPAALVKSDTEGRSPSDMGKTPSASGVNPSMVKKEPSDESDDDIIVVHESIKKPKQHLNPRPWTQLNVMEQSYVAKLASLVKLREVDITRREWFQELYGKAEKTIYHLDLDISNLRGTKMNYKKRLEQAKMTCHQLRTLVAKRQGRPVDDVCRARRIYWHQHKIPLTQWGFVDQCRNIQKTRIGKTPYTVVSNPLDGLHRVVDNLNTEGVHHHTVPSSPEQSKLPQIFSRRLGSPSSARRRHLDEIVDRLRSPPEVVPKDPVPSSQSSLLGRDRMGDDVRSITQVRQEAIQGTVSANSVSRKVLSPDDLKFFSVSSLNSITAAKRAVTVALSSSCPNNLPVESSCKNGGVFWSGHDWISESRAPSGLTAVHEQ